MDFDVTLYIKKIILSLLPIIIVVVAYGCLTYRVLDNDVLNLLIKAFIDVLIALGLTYLAYLNKDERAFIKGFIISKIKRAQ